MADAKSGRPRRRFTDEFKQQAVRLVLDEGKSVTAVARELDLVASALGQWVKQARADRSKGRTGLTTAEREELVRLRKALRIAEEERDILKNESRAVGRARLVGQKLRGVRSHARGRGRLLSGDTVNPLKNMVRGWLCQGGVGVGRITGVP
jgi:transposase